MILLVYGTRPEWIKLKPLIHEFNRNDFSYKTMFTGQHKDLVKETQPDYEAAILDGENRLDSILTSLPDSFSNVLHHFSEITHVMVQGDTTSAMAIALSAFHHNIKVIHLEAGLRTYDKQNPYPEEINRKIISQIADIHLCPTQGNANNLYNEHVDINSVHVVGNTVIDSLLPYKDKCKYQNKILVTLHRRENLHRMDQWFIELNKIAEAYQQYDFLLPIHPNPNVLKHEHLLKWVNVVNPLTHEGLIEYLVKCKLVITDSGGLQEESCFFNKKCLTCRVVTERPEAIGLSTFIVEKPELLMKIFEQHINDYKIDVECPFGDGHSAEKIIKILNNIK